MAFKINVNLLGKKLKKSNFTTGDKFESDHRPAESGQDDKPTIERKNSGQLERVKSMPSE